MATWYVAPDATTVTGVTVVALGTSGYATAWNKAAKWSDFNEATGVWKAKVASGDTVVFLAGRYLLSAAVSGWTALSDTFGTVTLAGQTVDGKNAFAVFVGGRDAPWPRAGNAGASSQGEVFLNLKSGAASTNLSFIWFRNVKYPITPNAAVGNDLGTVTFTDCGATNTAGGLLYTQARTDGSVNVVQTRCKVHGYSQANARVWGSIVQTDCVLDSEFQATAASRSSATSTSGAHVMDNVPGYTPARWISSATRCIYRNHAAGSSGGSYSQGDGFIGEENTGTFTAVDTLTYGNGDRGLDMKCGGTSIRPSCWGDGTGAVGHHLDTEPWNIYQMVAFTGARPAGASTSSEVVQSGGLTIAYQSALIAKPTAAQVANNAYCVTHGDTDISSWQASVFGPDRRGDISLVDCWLLIGTTAGATEQGGYTNSADNGRAVAIPGLTPAGSYNLKVRARAQDESASAYTSTVAYTMDAAGTGDTTGPAAPTNLAQSAISSSTVTMTWTKVAADAGVQIAGYMFRMKRVTAPADASYIYVMPTKGASPVTFSGLAVSTNYVFGVAAYDVNGNVGTFTSDLSVTTSGGSNNTSTPSVPLSPAVPSGWVGHPHTAGLQWSTPATGTVATYEVADNAGNVLVRTLPILTGNAASYTKTNVTVTTV